MAKVKDFVSGLTHCIGAAISLVGLVVLIVFAAINGDAFDVVSFSLFGTGLFLTYLFSTLYHWLNIGEKRIKVFKKFENIMIYVLIAVSFIPLCLGPLRGPWGWSIFGIICGLTTLGIIFSSIWIKMPKAASIPINISIICTSLIALIPFISVYIQANLLYSLWYLAISGIFYFMSGIIYVLKWPKKNFKQFGSHEIVHILLMLGSVFQYWFILNFITMF